MGNSDMHTDGLNSFADVNVRLEEVKILRRDIKQMESQLEKYQKRYAEVRVLSDEHHRLYDSKDTERKSSFPELLAEEARLKELIQLKNEIKQIELDLATKKFRNSELSNTLDKSQLESILTESEKARLKEIRRKRAEANERIKAKNIRINEINETLNQYYNSLTSKNPNDVEKETSSQESPSNHKVEEIIEIESKEYSDKVNDSIIIELSPYELKAIREYMSAISTERASKDIIRDTKMSITALIQAICIEKYKLSQTSWQFREPAKYFFLSDFFGEKNRSTGGFSYHEWDKNLPKIHTQMNFLLKSRNIEDYSPEDSNDLDDIADQLKTGLKIILKWYLSNYKTYYLESISNLSVSEKKVISNLFVQV